MTTDRFKDGIQWWMDTKTYGAYPNPPQWHIDTGNLVRLVPQPAQEPVAWMVYTQDGKSVYVTDNPTDIQEGQRALPLYTTPPQPVQEPVCDKDPQGCWNVRCQLGKQCKNLAQPAQERNFCSRCGKRIADLTVIHTCTPPQGYA